MYDVPPLKVFFRGEELIPLGDQKARSIYAFLQSFGNSCPLISARRMAGGNMKLKGVLFKIS